MNLAVYAICRNQAPYAARWAASMSEADGLYVLDAGSADGCPELLRDLGVRVSPYSADPGDESALRNAALALVPEDTEICVFTRLDQLFSPGWRALIRQCWLPWTQQIYCSGTRYSCPPGRSPLLEPLQCIHARRDFLWQGPEGPTYTGSYNPAVVYIPELQLIRLPIPPGPQ